MTLVNLIKNLELYLQSSDCLYTSYTKSQRDPAKLKSLRIMELRDMTSGKSRKVSLILEGTFIGQAPHEHNLKDIDLDTMGFASMSFGMGAFTFDNGTATKGMTVVLSKKLVEGALAKDLEKYRKSSASDNHRAAVAKVKKSASYMKATKELVEQTKAIEKAQNKMAVLQARLQKMHTTAIERARTVTKSKVAPFAVIVA